MVSAMLTVFKYARNFDVTLTHRKVRYVTVNVIDPAILHYYRLLYIITTKFGKWDKLLDIYQINRRVYIIPNS